MFLQNVQYAAPLLGRILFKHDI